MTSFTTIILCAGKRLAPSSIETSISNAMTPINGKPVIGWILDDLLNKKIPQATIVLRKDDQRFQLFLERAYSQRMQLTLARIAGDGTILHSLLAGLTAGEQTARIRVILGDTLIRDSFESDEDFIYIGDVEESRRWCLPVVDDEGFAVEYVDKKNLSGGPFKALAGYYHFLDADLLRAAIEKAISLGKRELSDALFIYGQVRRIRTRQVLQWFDLGHIDKIVEARKRLLQPRHFNSLSVNPVLNTITKVSERDGKLRDELDWYRNLPNTLQALTPRILNVEEENGHLRFVQEYYGYPTLAELYVYGGLDSETWFSILRNVLRIHIEFCRYKGELDHDTIASMYVEKTRQRMDEACALSTDLQSLCQRDKVRWNGQEMLGLPSLIPEWFTLAERLAANAPVHIVHGDLCFSNILYDLNNQIVRLIDPRGSFGKKGIYGDARYDIAKLRHSVSGLYDFLIADMFELREANGEFRSQIFANGVQIDVSRRFDTMIEKAGYALNDIKLIEAMLFLSMLPLHRENPKRQTMMYLRGLALLNDVVETVRVAETCA